MKSKITFVIPSLSRLTLIQTINSLLNQSCDLWKCIIVYDGVDGIDFNDDRIKTVKIEKSGLIGPANGQSGLVRNEGIKLVDTEWIGFLDDDDTIHPDYVKTLIENYYDYDFVVWRMKYPNGLILPPLNNDNLSFGRVGISFCYKNKHENLYFDNNRDGEDHDFLMKLISLSKDYIVTPEVYYNVRH